MRRIFWLPSQRGQTNKVFFEEPNTEYDDFIEECQTFGEADKG